MRALCRLAALCLLAAALAAPVHAQTTELAEALEAPPGTDERGFLQGLLEDALSGAGREVRIVDFQGALSSRATAAQITIADDEGVWLRLEQVVLDWDRSALLRGRVEIDELSAGLLVMLRPPRPAPAPEGTVEVPEVTAEAQPFSLPELPVSVRIGTLAIERAELGAELVGFDLTAQLQGSAQLADGEGRVSLDITRIDGPRGVFALAAGFDNATRELDLLLKLDEAAGGLAATALDIPGAPPVLATIEGAGPLDDFTADITLATDGIDRLTGQVTLRGEADEDGADGTEAIPGRLFSADLAGDVRPLVAERLHPFFGPRVSLTLRGKQSEEGLALDTLRLNADALKLAGALRLGPDGWPVFLDLDGTLGVEGSAEAVAIPGTDVTIRQGVLSLQHDADQDAAWQLEAGLTGITGPGIVIQGARLAGNGTLARGDGAAIGQVKGQVIFAATGLSPEDPDLARALGPQIAGRVGFAYVEGTPLDLTALSLSGDGYGIEGSASVAGLQQELQLKIDAQVDTQISDLARLSGIVGRPLGGSAALRVDGRARPLDGAFDLTLAGVAGDLKTGIAQADALLGGSSKVSGRFVRDETGITVDNLSVEASGIALDANALLRSQASTATARIRLPETGRVDARLSGPAAVALEARQDAGGWTVSLEGTAPGRTSLMARLRAEIAENLLTALGGTVSAEVADLSAYAGIAARPLAGALVTDGRFDAALPQGAQSLTLTAEARDLRVGIDHADTLLGGRADIRLSVGRAEGEDVAAVDLTASSAALNAEVSGRIGAALRDLAFALRISDIGLLTSGLSGPGTATGTVMTEGGPYRIAADATGPGGASVRLDGTAEQDFSRVDLGASGDAPLALANRFIAPNLVSGTARFDLDVTGPPALSSVSGRITTDGTRLALPAAKTALEDIAATVTLSGGQARVDLSAQPQDGGRLTLSGPVALSPPYRADLVATLTDIPIIEPGLYETRIDGTITFTGPAAGGATIAGRLELGEVEARVPDGGGVAGALLPGLRHVNEPAPVRRTRARAGVIDAETGRTETAGPAFPLDLTIAAPSRIFLRGRGLDAELGGRLRLRGTTQDVLTQGRFDLIRGRLDILGKRLDLTEGYVQLQGRFEPYIRIVADGSNAGVAIRIIIEGPASAPDLKITSDPALPEDEVLSYLLFGRAVSEISPLQAVRIAAALRTLAGGGGGFLDDLRDNTGLDDLDFPTDAEGNAGIRAGKYINENLYSDVTVNSQGEATINLNLQLTPQITARGTAGPGGETGIGIFFEKDY